MNKIFKKDKLINYISLKDASKMCSYSQEYLRLRARQKKLKAVKRGRNWFTTEEWVSDYVFKIKDKLENKNNVFRKKFYFAVQARRIKNIPSFLDKSVNIARSRIKSALQRIYELRKVCNNLKFVFCAVLIVMFFFSFSMAFHSGACGSLAGSINEFNSLFFEEGNKLIDGVENSVLGRYQEIKSSYEKLEQYSIKAVESVFALPSVLKCSLINLVVNSRITHKYTYRRANEVNEQMKERLKSKFKSVLRGMLLE